MKKFIFIFALLLIAHNSFAQEVDSALLLRQAVTSFNTGKFDEAISLMDKVITAYPNDAKTRIDKGYALILLNRQEEAQKTIFKAVDILPNTADKINTLQSMMDIVLNNAWAENAKYAKPYLDKLLALAPKDCMTNISKVQYYNTVGYYVEAVKAMENLKTVCTGDQSINIDGNIEYILALYKSGQEEKAFTLSNALFESVGESSMGYYLLPEECYPLILMQADILYRQGKYSEALSALKNTIENQEPDAELLLRKGVLNHLLNKKYIAGTVGKELVELSKTTQNWEAALRDGKKQGIAIKKGTKLRYTMEDSNETVYNLDITFTEYSPSQISFDWIMTGEHLPMKGTLMINEESINTAEQIEEDFSVYRNSASELRTISTILFLSKAMFSKLQKHEPLTLILGDYVLMTAKSRECNFRSPTFWSYKDKDLFNYMDAIEIKDYKAESKLVVQNDPNNPLILSYFSDIKMELISVE